VWCCSQVRRVRCGGDQCSTYLYIFAHACCWLVLGGKGREGRVKVCVASDLAPLLRFRLGGLHCFETMRSLGCLRLY
jgi:hypothetical protein